MPVEPSETLSAGLSDMLAHIINAISKSAVAAIMSFLVGMVEFWAAYEGRVAQNDGFLNK
ncbi:MAG: hypothetical protein COC21_07290 [Verrucomicrobiales bacterium]|nr:MAG: hypothetical protein COC21_07290 [Verrucomicrobiales bacterium]